MIRNKINGLYLLFISMILLGCYGCTSEGVGNEPSMLEIDQEELKLTKDKGELLLSVKSNEENIIAVSNREWLTAILENGSVKLMYDANEQIGERQASVLVQAGDAMKQVKVRQEGSALSVLTTPEKILMEPWENELTVSVLVNGKNWTVSSSEEWLKITAMPWKNEIVLKVDANKENKERKAEILFQVEGVTGNMSVTASQKEWPLFMLPFIDFEFGTKSIVTLFETGRRSMVSQITGSKFVDFNTISPFISRMSYTFSTRGVLQYAQSDIAEPYTTYDQEGNLVMTDEALELIDKSLIKEGFTEKRGTYGYYNPEKRVIAQVKKQYSFNPHVLYSYIPKQTEKYPTFEKFPYIPLDFGVSYDAIDTYEKNNGGVYDPSTSQYPDDQQICFIAYKVTNNKQMKFRNYFLSYDNVNHKPLQMIGTMQEWNDMNLVYYEHNGEFFFTEEFSALVEKEGFKYIGKNDDRRDVFVNESKGITLQVQFAHFSGADDPSLVLLMLPYHGSKNSTASYNKLLMDNHNKLYHKISFLTNR